MIPFHQGDAHLAKANLAWISQLDGKLSHGVLLACDPKTDWAIACDCVRIASSVFQRVEIITSEDSTEGWIVGANTLFKTAAKWFQDRHIAPWLWLEPDAVPLKKGWLDTIQSAYFAAGKPFFGAVMDALEPDMPRQYLAGVACYPHDCMKRMAPAWDASRAFDVATASVTVPFAASTPLICHFWGEKDLPPTFVAEKTPESPRNAFTLDKIHPMAVVFHRCKDPSLLRLLGYREPKAKIEIQICLPVHSGDSRLMLKNLQWMNMLHGKKAATATLLVDSSVQPEMSKQLIHAASAVFSGVEIHRYSARAVGWPAGANCAFQEACRIMVDAPWLFMEADMVPIEPDWLEQLSDEYVRAGRPIMGPVVDCMDRHANGTSIFPANFERLVPAVRNIKEAFDVALQYYIKPHLHNGNALMQHHLSPPSFASAPDLREIRPGVVVFHPAKSGHLQDRLAEQVVK